MDDQAPVPKKSRKLRAAPETVRQRSERSAQTIKPKPRFSLRFLTVFLKKLPIWKPIRLIGHYVIPVYFRNSWRELRLVTWPNRKMTLQLTWAVILFSVVFAALTGGLDYVIGNFFKEVIIK